MPEMALIDKVGSQRTKNPMLWTVLILLLTLWLLGLMWQFGGLVHLILVVAFVVFLIELFSGQRAAL